MPVPNEVAGRTDHTWQGPDTTINAGRRMTGAGFDAIRADAAAARAAAPKMSPMNKIARGDFSAIVGELTALIDRVSKLEGEVAYLNRQLAGQNPPHLARQEKRSA